MRRRNGTSSTVSSSTTTTPDPNATPAARVASNVSGRSISSGVMNVPAAPPNSTHRNERPSRTPPANSTNSRTDAPNSTSYTPARVTRPEMQNNLVPDDPSVPIAAYAAPPSNTIGSTLASVST